MSDILPSFRKPPLVEAVLAVQFDPIPMLVPTAHLGAFWETINSAWKQVTEVTALDQVMETFGEGRRWSLPSFQKIFARTPAMRLQAVNPENDHMVQIQNGWFVYNWRCSPTATDYPRYARVRAEFDTMHSKFANFLKDHSLDPMSPSLWEVTYVNRMDKGELWSTPSDWPALIPGLLGQAPLSCVAPEGLRGQWTFMIGDQAGRLHVTLQHEQREQTQDASQETLFLTLTARGAISPNTDGNPLGHGLDLGRRAIVNTFAEITSKAAQEKWQRES